ncbi:hypothetical protein [Nocardioides sp. SYSU D00038]|uniref:hypothetical protein n=1 Tax=Nocardioides sp. SYSU D00038 TaxID=2812554 RepID=UPI001966DCC2|nr:hypothetical protein [Nocardioides sp. SYSU D00038]
MSDLARYDDWLAWLGRLAGEDPMIRVAWIGGSAATGGWDEWSDLDVEVLCTPGAATEVYGRLLARARHSFDVTDVWEVPVATWPDGRQCFLSLHERPGLLAEPTRLVDLHVSDLADHHRRIDTRRHGTPVVVHDPEGLLELEPDDPAAMARDIEAAVDQVRQRRVTGEWLVNRALRRGHVAEGLDLYLRFALAPVVRLLRVHHCPWRHDYGLRYLRTDLPAEVADRVESLVPGHAPASLEELATRCFAWLDELLDA